ncbi:MAG: hypothetical protein WCI27_00860 [Candidatus Omnitrophota bacterium]
MVIFRRQGFILITALWTLTFLAVLAVTLLAGVRQRVFLFQRIEDRLRVQSAAEAGVKKALAVMLDVMEDAAGSFSSAVKQRLGNNPAEFAAISVGGIPVEVVHEEPDPLTGAAVTIWGLSDEQSKFNLNLVPRDMLGALFSHVMGCSDAEGRSLADAVVDWRDYGRHDVDGFSSGDYYKSLEFPYPMKEKQFERIDELLLVKGFNRKIYDQLAPFLTVYGDGRVNINTASYQILLALGLDAALADKILRVRRGVDGVEATADDHLFVHTFDIPADMGKTVMLEPREVRQIDGLNAGNLLGTESGIYSFSSRVPAADGGHKRLIACVFSIFESRILYWHEK